MCEDLDQAVNLLTNNLTEILDKMCPVKLIQIRSKYSPWLSEETKLLMKNRDEAQKAATLTNKNEDWNNYKKLRNKINNRLKVEKKNWQRRKLDNCESDPSRTWKNVKGWLGWNTGGPPTQLFHNGTFFNKPSDLSKTMNNFLLIKLSNYDRTYL